MKDGQQKLRYNFNSFEFDAASLRLFKNGLTLKIEPQTAYLLHYFLRHPATVLSRETLSAYLWPNRIVTDDALRSSIKKLREVLGDDAKSSRYIKTLPMRGYEFIASVQSVTECSPQTDSANISLWLISKKIYRNTLFKIGCAILLFGIFVVSFKPPSSTHQDLTISPLTTMKGSELRPSYDYINQRLLFSHRANKDDFLQLHLKDMKSGETVRLTWDDYNYGNAMWSADGSRFAFIKSTQNSMQHYISEYSAGQGMTNTTLLDHDILSTHYLIAWSNRKNALYLTDKSSPTTPQGVWLYDIDKNDVQQVTAPNVPGQGDYFVRESYDGTRLAILRSLSLNAHEILILHIDTGEVLFSKQLPEKVHRLVWSSDDSMLTLGTFDGKLSRINISTQNIEDITPNAPFLNNVFFECAKNCYYMRQHNGNYLDIAEQPNPFSNGVSSSFETLELTGANDFPMYANTTNKLYFVTHYNNTISLDYWQRGHGAAQIYAFENNSTMHSIALSQDDLHVVGLLNSRLFLLDLKDKKLSYLSKKTDIVYPPHWVDNTTFRYARLEKNQAVMYEYSTITGISKPIVNDYIAMFDLSSEKRLLLDKNYYLWLQDSNSLERLVKLPSALPNRIKVVGNHVYYTGREENITMLYQLSINSTKPKKQILAKNRFKANFSLSQDQHKLLIVKSLLAQSNLVKVNW